MTHFDRIYFDTNSFWGAWPKGSDRIKELAILARELKVALLVPRAVEIEFEERWRREFQSKYFEIRNLVKNFNRHTFGLMAPISEPPLPDINMAILAYQEKVDQFKKSLGIETVPSTLRTIDEFVVMEAR